MDLKSSFLIQTIVAFWVIAFLSFATADNMITGKVAYTSDPIQSVYIPPSIIGSPEPPFQAVEINVVEFLLSFLVATFFILFFLRVFKGKLLFEMLFSGAIIFGSQGPLGIYFPKNEAFLLAVGIIALRFIYPRIWTQNLAVILGISGIAASLGMGVKPLIAAIILILLSIYDIIAIYKTRHMINLFKGMAQKGAIFALIVPKNFSLWFRKFEIMKPNNQNEFIFLGTGDLALPLFFAVSVFPMGPLFYISTAMGATIGFFVDHIYFTNQKQKKPIPALPAIAFFSILGYITALYINFLK